MATLAQVGELNFDSFKLGSAAVSCFSTGSLSVESSRFALSTLPFGSERIVAIPEEALKLKVLLGEKKLRCVVFGVSSNFLFGKGE